MMNQNNKNQVLNWLEKGCKLWVKPDSKDLKLSEEIFLQSQTINIGPKFAKVELIQTNQIIEVQFNDCFKLTYGVNDVSDMIDLEELNQPQLLYNIKRRYARDQIFTYCGPTLLIINPYTYLDSMFNDSVLYEFQTLIFTDNLQYKNLSPHIFALAAFCLWQLFDNKRNQSIVISGESGAGKTENTKYCLKFLASLSKNIKQIISQTKNKKNLSQNIKMAEKAIKKSSTKTVGIQDKILGCNEVLQAFGNAKTIRNDNSSRFGKLIMLLYGQTQIELRSAYITSYLLQKSRIVLLSEGERNYHVFYYFCKGASTEEKKQYLLDIPMQKYHYLNQSTIYSLNNQSDQQKYRELLKEFEVYLNKDEIRAILKILSIVLNIGNLTFKRGQSKGNEEMVSLSSPHHLKNIISLLEVNAKQFEYSLQYKTLKTGSSIINSPLKYDEALALRDSLAKNIYERTFNFLVAKLNAKIQIEKIQFSANNKQFRRSIGLLDIFGFEVLKINSLQQFFINFANEKLQQLYVSYIFKEQQSEFQRQGLNQFSHGIVFQDNKPIIDLFQQYPLGIFHLINESSQLNKSDDMLPETISSKHGKNVFVKLPKGKRGLFEINHSCSTVVYNTNNFTAKNKDDFPQQLLNIIQESKNPVLKFIITQQHTTQTQGKNRNTKKFLGSKFLNSMNQLTQELYSSDCHFVRCIKPNSLKKPQVFDSKNILQSLRYLGVLDSIIIRKLGYIYRRPFEEFHRKFFQLQDFLFHYKFRVQGKNEDFFKKQSKRIIQKYVKKQLEINNILIGNKKILVKESTLNQLQSMVKQKKIQRNSCSNRIINMYRNAKFRVKVKKMMKSIKVMKIQLTRLLRQCRQKLIIMKVNKVQNVIKKYLWQKRFEKIKEEATKSVTKISAYYKMKKQRNLFLMKKSRIVKIQAKLRYYLSMINHLKMKMCQNIVQDLLNIFWEKVRCQKALLIQKNWKGYKVRKQYKQRIFNIRKRFRQLKVRNKFREAIFKHRYLQFKIIMNKYRNAAMKIQAVVKGKYIRRTYLQVLESVNKIQRVYRLHLHQKGILGKIWSNYREKLYDCEVKKQKQLQNLGIKQVINTENISVDQTVCFSAKLWPSILSANYLKFKPGNQDLKVNRSHDVGDKNSLQLHLLDYDIVSTHSYSGEWMLQYSRFQQEISHRNQYIININICDGFTILFTNRDRMYTFASKKEQYLEQLLPSKINLDGIPNSSSCCQQSASLIMNNDTVYQWGYQGYKWLQLLENQKLTQQKIQQIVCKGNQKYFISQKGQIFEQVQQMKIIPRTIGQITNIVLIAASYTFVHFLSNSGQLYSKGNNRHGQLGLGYTSKNQINVATLNSDLKLNRKQMIESIGVGMGHTIVRSKLGYVYTWGNNQFNQVSPSPNTEINSPVSLYFLKTRVKVLQIEAGFRSSFCLLENMKVIGLGVTNCTDKHVQPVYLQLLNDTNLWAKNLYILKLNCSWTREMSILTVNVLDKTKCKPHTKIQIIQKYCRIISKQWKMYRIYPDYQQWMDNILFLSDMRKFKFIKNQQTNSKKKEEKQTDLNELKTLMELRRTSTIFKNALRNKIITILKQLEEKTKQHWNQTDIIVNKYINENCRQILK